MYNLLRYNSGGLYKCHREWSWDFLILDYDLWAVFAGQGSMEIGGKKYHISAGDIFLLAPGATGMARHDPENPLFVMSIHFDGLTGFRHSGKYLHIKMADPEFYAKLMRQTLIAYESDRDSEGLVWLNALLLHMFSGIEVSNQRYESEVEKICQTIIEYPDEEHSISGFAEELSMTVDHFRRIFKQIKGCSPGFFIQNSRTNHAKWLLTHSNMPVYEIADKCGYKSVNFFCRQFKKITGITPGKYKEKSISD